MKGIRIYLIVFGVLLGLSAYLLLSRRSGSYAPSTIGFAVQDTGNIELVQISRQGEKVQLSRTGGSWTVNGGMAREEAIRGLSVLISRIEVEAPVSKSIEKRILDGFRNESAEVFIGMRDGRDKSYLVYFDSTAGSTFMMGKDSDEAFRVRVRGYRNSNLAEMYRSNPRYWRDNIIFQFSRQGISAITLLNNLQPERSFHLIKNEDGEFEISGGFIPGLWSLPDKASLDQYLGYFQEVRFEAFIDPAGDSVFYKADPDYIISVKGIREDLHTLKLFPVYHITGEGEKQAELNHLFGRIESMDDWIVIKYVQIDPLLQEFEYFK